MEKETVYKKGYGECEIIVEVRKKFFSLVVVDRITKNVLYSELFPSLGDMSDFTGQLDKFVKEVIKENE